MRRVTKYRGFDGSQHREGFLVDHDLINENGITYQVDPSSVQEFVKQDTSGKDIFTGDTVTDESLGICKVEWSEDFMCYIVRSKTDFAPILSNTKLVLNENN